MKTGAAFMKTFPALHNEARSPHFSRSDSFISEATSFFNSLIRSDFSMSLLAGGMNSPMQFYTIQIRRSFYPSMRTDWCALLMKRLLHKNEVVRCLYEDFPCTP